MSVLTSSRVRSGLWMALLIASLAFTSLANAQKYKQTNLISDVPGWAATTDPNLVNAWGIAFSSSFPGVDFRQRNRTLHSLHWHRFHRSTGGHDSSPERRHWLSAHRYCFRWQREVHRSLRTWSPAVRYSSLRRKTEPSADGARAWTCTTRSLPLITLEAARCTRAWRSEPTAMEPTFIYATNFNSGWVEMYDSNFKWVRNFTDGDVPWGYAPFGIQNIDGKLYVTFALQDDAKHDDTPGAGHGFVDVFDLRGNKLKRLISRGTLNSPWGLAWAPSNFGRLSGDLLVGNFGNGHINAFDISTGAAQGPMLRSSGSPLEIQGLWGLAFGNGAAAGPNQHTAVHRWTRRRDAWLVRNSYRTSLISLTNTPRPAFGLAFFFCASLKALGSGYL